MFVGSPPGNYDRLLDFSRAVTGSLFFVPSATFLENVRTTNPRHAVPPPAVGAGPRRLRRRATVRSALVRSKETRHMNNLHRELAPISDAAWAQIEEETSRTLKRYLAARRVVDVQGPGGVALSAVGTGHLRNIKAPGDGIIARQREVKALVELRVPFELESPADRRRGARRRRLRLAAGEGRRADGSPLPKIAPFSTAMPPAASAASAKAPAIR